MTFIHHIAADFMYGTSVAAASDAVERFYAIDAAPVNRSMNAKRPSII